MKRILIFIGLIAFFSSAYISAASIQDWLKKGGGYQKTRKIGRKQTMVAAVRGVEEAGEVDRDARNFDALAKMESRAVPREKLSRFITSEDLKSK